MNYRRVYFSVIKNAKQETSEGKRDSGYYERHHIFPKSLFPLWKDRKSNTVKLTAREHLFCHMLLVKIYPKSHEMWSALWYMSCKSKKEKSNYPKLTLREYERIKVQFAESNSKHLKGKKNSNMKRKFSKETLQKISEKSKGNSNVKGKVWWTKDGESTLAFDCPGDGWKRGRNTKGKEAWNKGSKMTEQQKDALSKALKEKYSEMTKDERNERFGVRKGKEAWNKDLKMSTDFKEKCRIREQKKKVTERFGLTSVADSFEGGFLSDSLN